MAESWRRQPPAGPLIAAGSTGTAPANAALLATIAGLPMGAVVLPGLDLELAEDAWTEVGEQHPQGAMKRLLERAGLGRGQIRSWPASGEAGESRWRRRIINESLRPPEATKDWMIQIAKLQSEAGSDGVDPMVAGLDGLQVLTARTEEDAAALAALLMRETLETPGKTCALVTPDQALARRVAARLSRWGIEADSSAGAPLAGAPVGVLAMLVARAVLDPADPVCLLAILKHPLVRLGLEARALERSRGGLERLALRGPRGAVPNWIELKLARLAAEPREGESNVPEDRAAAAADASRLLGMVQSAIQHGAEPYTGGTATPAEAARGLVLAMEALTEDDTGASSALWAGPDGEAAAELISALVNESEGLPEARPAGFARLVEALIGGVTVRAGRRTHPRLKILGAIESRLVSADRLILAGLEEGVWPQGAPVDPFLSRPMRAAFGLPPPERRIGLSAHDFAQAACAPEVVLLHAERREGAPATPSRWLWRLRTLAMGAGAELETGQPALAWVELLDLPGPPDAARRPRPRPPVKARPRELPVTGVETWLRDPYAIYARYVLKLRPMLRPDEPVEARARGEAVHRALQRFAELYPDSLPDDAQPRLQQLLMQALTEAGMPTPAMAREGALAIQAASWLTGFEGRRRQGARILVEQKGVLSFLSSAGRFTVTARADRLELREGRADVLDFKTGSPPTRPQVETDFAPQLTLTAAILEGGGFAEVGPMTAGDLLYVQVSGRRSQKEPRPVVAAGESSRWAQRALSGLKRRAARYDLEDTAYVSWAAPQYMNERGGDYDHLARVWEWHVIGDSEDE